MYIAGWGRSGTTIVDNIFNSYDNVFSTGELFYLWHRGLMIGRKCGCGVKFANCVTWRSILAAAFGDQLPDPAHVVELQKQTIRVRHTQSLADGVLSAEAQEYLDIYTKLYHAIAEVTGAKLIVDSSKVPSGAALLTRMPGTVPYLLHMVRDPRAVTHSWMRAAPPPEKRNGSTIVQSPTSSTVHWLARNAITERLTRAFPGRHARLRYEDFAADPQAAIEDLLDLAGVASADGPFVDANTVRLKPNHTIAGNPSRFRNGDIAVEADDRWVTEQRFGPRLTSTALAWPFLHRYGYRTRV
ncbi:sulfotransferase [Actinoplanes sp. NPDC026619]|uniref:sulfotransferase n=1 Tax=Actinoplanes sp. NPDC026619 TaxID=3155798 RepID=UPI0033EC2C1E